MRCGEVARQGERKLQVEQGAVLAEAPCIAEQECAGSVLVEEYLALAEEKSRQS